MRADGIAGDAAERLRAARSAAYGPGGTADDVRRLHELEAALGVAPAAGPEEAAAAEARPAGTPRRARVVAVAAAALAVGAVAGGAAGFSAGAAQAPPPAAAATTPAPSGAQLLRERIIESNGVWSADDYYRLYPSDLPPDWRADDVGRDFLQLAGPTTLPVETAGGSTALLVVLTCPTRDGRSTWVLRGADGGEVGAAQGRCGRLDGTSVRLPEGRGPYTLRVSTAGPSGYSVAVFEQ